MSVSKTKATSPVMVKDAGQMRVYCVEPHLPILAKKIYSMNNVA